MLHHNVKQEEMVVIEVFAEDDLTSGFRPNYPAARIHLEAALEVAGKNKELIRAKQIARRDSLVGHVTAVKLEMAGIDEELGVQSEGTI